MHKPTTDCKYNGQDNCVLSSLTDITANSPPSYTAVSHEVGWKLSNDHDKDLTRWSRKLLRNGSKQYQVGFSTKDSAHPESTFTCLLQPRRPSISGWFIRYKCDSVVNALAHHRHHEGYCHCDLEYLKIGRTSRDTERLCIRDGKMGRKVLKKMKEHDELCACGCFSF